MSVNRSSTEVEIASASRRMLAFIIDVAIISVINLALVGLMGDPEFEKRETVAVLLVATTSYHLGFLIARSATPGKMAMGMYVSDQNGARLLPDKAILRCLVVVAGNLSIIHPVVFYGVLGLYILNVALISWDPKRRTVHDRIAGTLVVNGRTPPWRET